MKTNIKSVNNNRDIIKRKKRIKNELKIIIIRSLVQNRKLAPIMRLFFKFKMLIFLKKNQTLSNQQNICNISGKKKTTFKITSMSRQYTKRLIEQGFIQSIRIK